MRDSRFELGGLADLGQTISALWHVAQADLFWQSAAQSLLFGIPVAVIGAACALAFALCLKLMFSRPARWGVFWLLIAPLFSNYYLRTFATRIAIGDTGVWPAAWKALTGDPTAPPLLFTIQGTFLYYTLVAIPYAFLFIFIAMDGIGDNEVAAAKNLGGTTLRIIRSLILPRIRTGVLIGAIAVFVVVFGDHIAVGVIGGNRQYVMPSWTLDLWKENDFPRAGAVALWQIMIVLIPISVLAFRVALKEER